MNKNILPSVPDIAEIPENVKLVFNDDFNCEKLNEEVYSYCLFSKPQDSDKKSWELVKENVSLKDGSLILNATKGSDTHYRGAEIRTREKFGYGFYEIKAKMAPNKGILPAFWLVDNGIVNNWHYEIDIFECFAAYTGTVKGTLLAHYYADGHAMGDKRKKCVWEFDYKRGDIPLVEGIERNKKETFYEYGDMDEWHTYGLDWKKDSVTWYVDGVPTLHADIPQYNVKYGDFGETFDCYFDNPLQVVLTCYSGNNIYSLTGACDDDMDWSKGTSLEIDYLRIWQYE